MILANRLAQGISKCGGRGATGTRVDLFHFLFELQLFFSGELRAPREVVVTGCFELKAFEIIEAATVPKVARINYANLPTGAKIERGF